MGNQASSSASQLSSEYQSNNFPGSFFTPDSLTTEEPPPYAQHSLVEYVDSTDMVKIVYRTSDGEYFSLLRKDAESHAGALLPSTWSPRSVVDLPESSIALRTLFEFIGARKHPKLLNETFDTLAEIANAAEKYKVFSAMNICAERMRSFGDRHPKLVLLYAAYSDYPHIFDECAPRVITSENIENITPLLPEHLRLPWLRYHARWSKALADTISYTSSSSAPWSAGSCWRSCGQIVYHALGTGVHALNDPSWVFVERVESHRARCSQCKTLCDSWKAHAEKQIEEVGNFSEKCMGTEPVKVDKT